MCFSLSTYEVRKKKYEYELARTTKKHTTNVHACIYDKKNNMGSHDLQIAIDYKNMVKLTGHIQSFHQVKALASLPFQQELDLDHRSWAAKSLT